MCDEPDLRQHIIGLIYDGVTDSAAWGRALVGISKLIGSSSALIFTPYAGPEQNGVWISHSLERSCFDRYVEHYVTTDLWLRAYYEKDIREGYVVADQDLVEPERFGRSEWYNDFLKNLDIQGVLSTVVCERKPDEDQLHISLFRPIGSEAFSDHQKRLLKVFAPHLGRAWKLRSTLSAAKAAIDASGEVLDRLGYGFVLISARGQVRLTNAVAQSILARRDGLVESRGELSALKAGETARLRALIAAVNDHRGIGETQSLDVSRISGAPTYKVFVSRAPKDAMLNRGREPATVVLIRDPDRRPKVDLAGLRSIWGLTQAETEIVADIAEGDRSQNMLKKRDVSIETARWHLKNALSKAGMHSQRDLVRFLQH